MAKKGHCIGTKKRDLFRLRGIITLSYGKFEKYQVTQTLHRDNLDRELSSFVLDNTHLKGGANILLGLDVTKRKSPIKAQRC